MTEVEIMCEGWGVNCVDDWPKYYLKDATKEEIKTLTEITNKTNGHIDENNVELYQEAVSILHDIFIRQQAKEYKIISSELKTWGNEDEDELEKLQKEDEIDPDEHPFGYTIIHYTEKSTKTKSKKR